MTNSDKDGRQRGYVRKHYEAQKAEGKVKCSFWITPEADAALVAIMASTGEKKQEVLNRALVSLLK